MSLLFWNARGQGGKGKIKGKIKREGLYSAREWLWRMALGGWISRVSGGIRGRRQDPGLWKSKCCWWRFNQIVLSLGQPIFQSQFVNLSSGVGYLIKLGLLRRASTDRSSFEADRGLTFKEAASSIQGWRRTPFHKPEGSLTTDGLIEETLYLRIGPTPIAGLIPT